MLMEIDIRQSCLQRFRDIGHDPDAHDTTYEMSRPENAPRYWWTGQQAHGLVIGAGDMSELALGWCTYNGDHMSMYSVNSGVPKP